MIKQLLMAAGLGIVVAAGAWAQASSTPSRSAQGSSTQGRTFVTYEPANAVSVTPGHNMPVSFVFHVTTGYHINSNQPTKEELIPTQLHFTLPGEIAIGKVQYPPGQYMSFPFDPTEKLSVYSGDVTIRAVIIAPTDASPGTYTIHGELKYQACDNNACYPPKKLPIAFGVNVVRAGRRSTHPSETEKLPHTH
jgi:hypothetical protein